MTRTSTEQELYEKWRDDYALKYEPNYDEHLNADCKAAFIAGMQAARRAQLSQKHNQSVAGLDGGVIRGNPSFDKPQAPKAPPRIIDSTHASAKR